MNWDAAKLAVDVGALALSLGSWIYARRVSRSQAQRAEIESLKKSIESERDRRRHDVQELESRLTRGEARIDGAPTGGALHELALAIKELAGDVKVLFTRIDGLGEVVKRLEVVANRQEDFLLNMKE